MASHSAVRSAPARPAPARAAPAASPPRTPPPAAPPRPEGGSARGWVEVPERRRPAWFRPLLRAYLWGLVGALGLVALLFLVNIFVPVGKSVLWKAILNLLLVLGAWGWGILGALMITWPPLRVSGFLGMALGLVGILTGTAVIWELSEADILWELPWAFGSLQFFMAAAVAAWHFLLRRLQVVVSALTLTVCGAAGIVTALHVLEVPFDDRFVGSVVGPAVALAAGMVLMYLPGERLVNVARWISYSGFALWAVTLAVLPWAEGDFVRRLLVSSVALAILLSLAALTVYLIGRHGGRQAPVA